MWANLIALLKPPVHPFGVIGDAQPRKTQGTVTRIPPEDLHTPTFHIQLQVNIEACEMLLLITNIDDLCLLTAIFRGIYKKLELIAFSAAI